MGKYEETGVIVLFFIVLTALGMLTLLLPTRLNTKKDNIKNNIQLEIIITEEGEVECTNIETD